MIQWVFPMGNWNSIFSRCQVTWRGRASGARLGASEGESHGRDSVTGPLVEWILLDFTDYFFGF